MGKPIIKKRGGARKPAFMCSAHATPVPMTYDPESAKWVCTDSKCVQFRRPEQTTTAGTMVLRRTPKLILRDDDDGDAQAFLFWEEHDIMVPIPFKDMKTFRASDGMFLRWWFGEDDINTFDANGNPK